MERMQRWREPAVVVVTAALLLRLVLVVVLAATSARLGLDGLRDSADLAGRRLGEPLVFVVIAALVACCHARPATRHVRTLTALALVVAGLNVLLALVLAVLGYRTSTPPFSQLDLALRLVDLVVPLLAVGTLAVLLRRPRPVPEAVPALAPAQQDEEAAAAEEPQSDPELQPTWQPDAAAGAAWYTAGDAASGRPAAGWGSPGSSSGWQATPQLPPSSPQLPPSSPRPTAGDDAAGHPPEDQRHDGGPPRS
jgi:hypothetical protein